MTAEIRILRESDAEAWWEIRRESLERDQPAFGKALEEHERMPMELARQRFRDAAEGDWYYGAFDGAALVGMATFIRETGILERHKGHLYGFYVTAPARGSGIGGALIARIVERAREDPTLEQILLDVATTQAAARRLYARFGFESYGLERRALKIGAGYVDEEKMVLFLRDGGG